MRFKFSLGEKVKVKQTAPLEPGDTNEGTVIDRWIDTFNRCVYKIEFVGDSYSYKMIHREDELTGLWDIHNFKPTCECGAVKTLNPMNHAYYCPLAKLENDN